MNRPEYGHAVISIEKHEPQGVFRTEWYSVNSECRGCPMSCGSGCPTANKNDLDQLKLSKLHDILHCSARKGNVKIHVQDFRSQQQKMG